MGWSRNDKDEVVLTMSYEDFQRLILALGCATGASCIGRNAISFAQMIGLVNRLNEGNPNFTPYEIPAGAQ